MRVIGAAQGAAIATAINVDNMLVHVCLELGRARQAHGFALQAMQLVVMDQKLLLEQYTNLEKAPHIDALLAHSRAKRATGDGDGGLHALQNAIELNQAAFGETARFEALAAEYMMMDAQRRFEGVSANAA